VDCDGAAPASDTGCWFDVQALHAHSLHVNTEVSMGLIFAGVWTVIKNLKLIISLYWEKNKLDMLFQNPNIQLYSSVVWLTGQGPFWCHRSPPCIPLQSPWDHWLAAEERRGGPRGLHRYGRHSCSLRCCQGRPALTPTVTGAQPKVRAMWFGLLERSVRFVLKIWSVIGIYESTITFALKMRKVMFWLPCIYLFVCVLLV